RSGARGGESQTYIVECGELFEPSWCTPYVSVCPRAQPIDRMMPPQPSALLSSAYDRRRFPIASSTYLPQEIILMKITRRFTKAGQNVYDQFEYTLRSSMLRNPDGSVVFEMHDIEVPKSWSQVATDILAQKYFRKAGVP